MTSLHAVSTESRQTSSQRPIASVQRSAPHVMREFFQRTLTPPSALGLSLLLTCPFAAGDFIPTAQTA